MLNCLCNYRVMPHSAVGLAPENAIFKKEIYTQSPNYFSPAEDDNERIKIHPAAIKTLL